VQLALLFGSFITDFKYAWNCTVQMLLILCCLIQYTIFTYYRRCILFTTMFDMFGRGDFPRDDRALYTIKVGAGIFLATTVYSMLDMFVRGDFPRDDRVRVRTCCRVVSHMCRTHVAQPPSASPSSAPTVHSML